jgi:hypothetical protein
LRDGTRFPSGDIEMRGFTIIHLSIVVLVPASCAAPTEVDPRERAGEVTAPIVGDGARVDDIHAAVVYIGGPGCTGTIVGRSAAGDTFYVLSAAHCCEKSSPPEEIRVGADYLQPTARFSIQGFQQHPCYSDPSHDYDICILWAKDDGTLNVTPIPLASAPDGLAAGSTVTLVGYGNTPATNFVRHRVEARLADVTSIMIATDQTRGQGGQCYGDSGGPVLITQGGVERVAGVASVLPAPVSALCNIGGVSARVVNPGIRVEFIDKLLAGEAPVITGNQIWRSWITPGPVRDTYIASDQPWQRFGSSVELLAGTHSLFGAPRRILVRFDLSGIPAGATLLTARAGLHQESTTGPGTITVHRVTKDWDEERETWASFGRSGFDPTPVARLDTPAAAASRPHQPWFDVTGLARDWLAGRAQNYGMMLLDSGREKTQLFSSEIGGSNLRPRLHVCYLPASPR